MSKNKFGIIAGIVFAAGVVFSPVASACSLNDLSSCDNNGLMALILQLLAGQSQTTTPTTPVVSGIPAGFQFNTNLKLGSTGNDVKYLQIFLNSDPTTAVGNTGSETTYFGSMTQAAVIKFQNKYASEVLTPYGLSAGTGFFGTSSRAKANAMISSVVPTTPTTPTTPVATGFTVALASTNPAASTLIQGQATADLAHYTFSNGTANPIKVTSITLNRTGVSADATLASVYLFDGVARVTDAASVSGGVITYNNPNGIFTIPANTVKTIAVKSDIAGSTSGQTIGVSLSSVLSDGTLSSVLPIASNTHTIANATLASVTVGTVQPSSAITTDPISGVRVWEAPFTVLTRNVQFTKLALKQINSIDKADISNFKLLIDGVEVASVPYLDANGYVTFTFDKTLTTGIRNVKVLADVTGGSSRYIQMSLRNKADIDVKDAEYGVNVSISPSTATASTIQVNSGTFSIVANNASLPVTVANNTSGALIGKWTFKATGEAVKVETLTVGFNETGIGGTPTLRNGRLMINGVQAGSTASLLGAGTQYSVNYTFQPGVETVVEVYADIYNNESGGAAIVNGDTIQAKLVYVASNATKQVSLGTMSVPTSAQATATVASTLSVGEGSTSLIATPSYGAQSTVLPQTAFKIGSWTLTAGTAEDINVNGFDFVIPSDSNDATFTVQNLADMYATYQIGSGSVVTTSVIPTPTAAATFSTSFVLPKGQTVSINLYSNLVVTSGVTGSMTVTSLTVNGTGSQSGSAANSAAVAGQAISVASGSLAVTKDASTPVASLVVAGNTIKAASYKFEALNDAYTISQLTFALTGTTAVTNVYLKDGTSIIASAVSGSTVTFNLPTPLTIAANATKILDVEVALGSIGIGTGVTGSNVSADLTSVLQRPASTGTAAVATVTLDPANSMYAYKATPTITLGTLPSSTLQVGSNTISRLTVSSTGGTIAWDKMIFNVSKSDASGSDLGAITSVTLWDGSTQVPGTAVIASALGSAGTQTGTITFYPTNEEQVAGSKTYDLRVNVGGVVATSDSISVSIPNNSTSYTASGKSFASVGALIYADADASATVTANDVRKTAANNYTAANTADGTVVTVAGTTVLSKVSSLVVGTDILALTKTGATWTAAGGIWAGATVTGGNDTTCPSTVTATTGEVATISGCTALTGNGTLTITPAAGTAFAINSVVASGNSDLGLVLTPGISGTASFIWSDISKQSHSIATEDWTTDYLVKNLPTSTQVISR